MSKTQAYAGIEIGGTKQQIALGFPGNFLERKSIRLGKDTSAKNILSWIRSAMDEFQEEYEILRVGVGFGGPLDSPNNRIHQSCQIEGWENFPLEQYLSDTLGVPVTVRNDTVTGGLTEFYEGNGKGSRRLFYTNIGTGIGGGIFTSAAYQESSFGYLYAADFREGNEGKSVALERLCSGKDTEERLNAPGYIPAGSLLHGKGHVSMADVADAVEKGDPFAAEELDRITEAYGIALAGFLAVTYCDRVVIGGGVANMGEILFSRIRKYTDEYAFVANKGRYAILPSRFMDDAVLEGALLLAESEEIRRLPWY